MPLNHTAHMINLLLSGYLWNSMPFEMMAEVMTAHGRDTTHDQAMDAYENCSLLGYPRGGTPKAWDFTYDGETLDFPSIEEMFYCDAWICNNVVTEVGLCEDCRLSSREAVPREPRTSDLTGKTRFYGDNCRCGNPNHRFTCRCGGNLCRGCCPRNPITGALTLSHWDCMTPEQKRRFNRA